MILPRRSLILPRGLSPECREIDADKRRLRRRWPGARFLPHPFCSPCCTCDYFTDDFAVDDLSTNWTAQSGTWAIGSGKLSTSSTSAIVDCNTEPPAAPYVVRANVYGNTGDKVRVYLGNTADYLEIVIGGNAVLTVNGSTDTQTAPASGTQITCCVKSDRASVSWSGAYTMNVNQNTTGTVVSLGTGDSAENVSFDNFLIGKSISQDSKCYTCGTECQHCIDDKSPDELLVTIEGITTLLCSYCPGINGDYSVLDNGACSWIYYFPTQDNCFITSNRPDFLSVGIANEYPNYYINVSVVPTLSPVLVLFKKQITIPFNCATFDEVLVPVSWSSTCDVSGATARVRTV